MMCVVIKPFMGGGVQYISNQLVDGGLFGRKEQVLITARHLRLASPDEVSNARLEDDEDDEPPVPPPTTKKVRLKARKVSR
jgi:hypothetical protein